MKIHEKMRDRILKDRGFTYLPAEKRFLKAGEYFYCVSLSGRGVVFKYHFPTVKDIELFVNQNAEILKKGNVAVGGWEGPDDIYLDITVLIPYFTTKEHREALKLALTKGKQENQKAIYDLYADKEILL